MAPFASAAGVSNNIVDNVSQDRIVEVGHWENGTDYVMPADTRGMIFTKVGLLHGLAMRLKTYSVRSNLQIEAEKGSTTQAWTDMETSCMILWRERQVLHMMKRMPMRRHNAPES